MIKLTYEQIVQKIKEKTGVSDEEINTRVKQKLDQLAGLISKDGAAHIIANELGVNAFEDVTGKVKLNKILPGMRSVEVLGKVKAIYDLREFTTQKGSGKVKSFLIADDTGTIRITCWNSTIEKITNIKAEDVVRIKNAYVKENNGRSEIHLNDRSEIEFNPAGETVNAIEHAVPAQIAAQRKKIAELNEQDSNVEILGPIVQVFEPRFYEICPMCGKRVKQKEGQFTCEQHSTVTPDYSYVMNAVVDDGSETIRAVFFREQAEQLIRKPRAEIIQYREFKEKFDEVKIDLLGQMVKITGRVTKNAMFDRLEITARSVDMNPNPQEEIEKLNKQLGNEITT
jgi:ssDNA-binding replication factor A large subunit